MKRTLVIFTALVSASPAFGWFAVCNKSVEPIAVAFAYYDRNDKREPVGEHTLTWKSEGWWALKPSECARVYPHELWRRNRYYFVHAHGVKNEWGADLKFC